MRPEHVDSGTHSSSGARSDYHESHEDDPLITPSPCIAEKRLLRKLDGRILPVTCVLYMFACLDRSNLGNARLQGLPEDVLGGDPTGLLFDRLVAIFFVTYILCQVPWTVLSKCYNPRIWVGYSAILWGLCSTSMSIASNFESLLIARLGLGIFEAAFGPSVVLYFSLYYTKAECGTRVASWFGFAAVAGAFGGLVAYGIQHVKTSLGNWRLLFAIEGVPTILVGVLCLFILPGRPESTDFLTNSERKLALDRTSRGTSGDVGVVVNRRHVLDAFLDWRIYVAGVICFGSNCALGSLAAFLPTIIETMGHPPALSQLMTVPPYAVAALILVMTSYVSDRIQSRGFLVVSGCILAGLGYMILLGVPHAHNHIRYLSTFLVSTGAHVAVGLLIAWFVHNLGSETKRAAGMPLYGAIGQSGNILGAHLYPLTEGPAYSRGFGICGALMFFAAFLAMVLTISYRLENSRRNAASGEPDYDAPVDTSELADKAPGFRYLP